MCQRCCFSLSDIFSLLLGKIDNIGQGKFFLMVYYQSKPVRITYKIQSLTQTHIRVSFLPLKIGTYRIYLSYRNFPINGK
jgi:hypothetical protein